ncbi:MAG: diguanylate cyclase [Fimbriimonadaceae bacterium]|nr:diguanylate cyclase [Fimbriimonadaceae bacterium]QYK59668.1 MAG: diguanylate cyclase [Fimbriimonadaceae bacterium]
MDGRRVETEAKTEVLRVGKKIQHRLLGRLGHDRAWRSLALLCLVITVGLVLVFLAPGLTRDQRLLLAPLLHLMAPIGLVLLALSSIRRAVPSNRAGLQSPWWLVGGVVASLGGDFCGLVARAQEISPAHTAWATVPLYASSYVLFLIALGTVPWPKSSADGRLQAFLESLILTAGVASLWWTIWLGPILANWKRVELEALALIGFPLIDFLLVSLTVALAHRCWERSNRKLAIHLLIGFGGLFVADLVSVRQIGQSSGDPFGLHSIVTTVAYMVLLLGALVARGGARSLGRSREAPSLVRLALPYLALPTILVSLFVAVWLETDRHTLRGVIVLSVVAGAAALVRQLLELSDSRALAINLVEANLRLESEIIKTEEAFRTMEEIAVTDNLTGLPNRRALLNRLEVEIARANRFGTKLSCVAADIDHFKSLNDEHGHSAGDDALRAVSRALVQGLRSTDFVARYGGEEFIALLPGSSEEEAAQIAERMRLDVQSLEGLAMRVTVSLGVGEWMQSDTDSRDVIDRTDAALYASKNAGRNQVRVASEAPIHLDGPNIKVDRDLAHAEVDGKVRAAIDFACRLQGWSPSDGATELVRGLIATLELRHLGDGSRPHIAMWATMRLLLAFQELNLVRIERELAAKLALGSLLHDIGKIGLEDRVVRKRGVLTDNERERAENHTILGSELVTSLPSLKNAAGLVRSHHERWDGGGYPDRLSGESIPLEARVFSLIDAFLAMRSVRTYRAELSPANAWAQIERDNGRQFDPLVVRAFLSVPLEEWEAIRAGEYSDEELGDRVFLTLPSAA